MIYYSQCWEDHALMREALAITPNDTVACIASGGENVLALLLDDPARVIATDTEEDQLRLLRLKITAIKHLSFHECAQLLGYEKSTQREELLAKLNLPKKDVSFWSSRLDNIAGCGRFEKHLQRFRTYALALVPGKKRVREYLAQKPNKREKYYQRHWDGTVWKCLLRFFFSSRRLASARHKELATHDPQELLDRIDRGLKKNQDSYYLHYVLTGEMQVPQQGHPYLDPKNFPIIKQRVDRIELRNQSLREAMQTATKICASDIFDAQSQEAYEQFMQLAEKTLPVGGRICYWNNFVDRYEHASAFSSIHVSREDRVFFYRRFIAEQRT